MPEAAPGVTDADRIRQRLFHKLAPSDAPSGRPSVGSDAPRRRVSLASTASSGRLDIRAAPSEARVHSVAQRQAAEVPVPTTRKSIIHVPAPAAARASAPAKEASDAVVQARRDARAKAQEDLRNQIRAARAKLAADGPIKDLDVMIYAPPPIVKQGPARPAQLVADLSPVISPSVSPSIESQQRIEHGRRAGHVKPTIKVSPEHVPEAIISPVSESDAKRCVTCLLICRIVCA